MSDFLQLLVTHPAYDYLCIFFPPHSHFGALLTRILERVKIVLLWLNSVNCILHFGRDPIISFAGLVLSSFGSFASMFVFLAHLHLSGQHVVSAVSLVSPAAKKTTKLWQDFTLDDNGTRSENLDVPRRWQAKSHDKIFLFKIVITAQV